MIANTLFLCWVIAKIAPKGILVPVFSPSPLLPFSPPPLPTPLPAPLLLSPSPLLIFSNRTGKPRIPNWEVDDRGHPPFPRRHRKRICQKNHLQHEGHDDARGHCQIGPSLRPALALLVIICADISRALCVIPIPCVAVRIARSAQLRRIRCVAADACAAIPCACVFTWCWALLPLRIGICSSPSLYFLIGLVGYPCQSVSILG